MKRWPYAALASLSFLLLGCMRQTQITSPSFTASSENHETIPLPAPHQSGTMSLEEALLRRRSQRSYRDEPLSLDEISQLLWAGQGITKKDTGGRTAPSAGALYPIELFLVVLKGTEPEPGIYQYMPDEHQLLVVDSGDFQDEIHALTYEQGTAHQAAVVLFLSADPERLEEKYGNRSERYSLIEAGHIAQNILLQATALDLHAVSIGAIHFETGQELFRLGDQEIPIYVLPVGHPPAEQ